MRYRSALGVKAKSSKTYILSNFEVHVVNLEALHLRAQHVRPHIHHAADRGDAVFILPRDGDTTWYYSCNF